MAYSLRRMQAGPNKGDIPARDLRDIMQFVSSNHALICKRWKETTGGLSFYC